MTRREYLAKLKSYLRNLPSGEVEDLLVYYRELFDEQNIQDTDQVPEHLESPRQVALDVLAEVNLRSEDIKTEPTENLKKNTWLIILLAIFAAPIGLPFVLAIIGLLIGMVAVIFAIFVALFAMVIAPIGVLLRASVSFPSMLFLLGFVLLGIGLLGLFLPLIPKAFHGLSQWISKRIRCERSSQ